MTRAQVAEVGRKLGLPDGATYAEVLARAEGLVEVIRDLKALVYVGIIDQVLTAHDITLEQEATPTDGS